MASAVPGLSREETNFLRVANLLIRLSPQAVRILFDREFNPGGLKSVFSKYWTKLDKLKKKHVITQAQWCLLFPSGSDPKSNDFDLTLMVCLLRNLTTITIQDQLPQPSDLSEGAAVSRIKFYRNQIAHSDSGAMSDADFSTTFVDVSKAIEILCPTMKSYCITLQNAELDYSFHEIYVEFVKKENQIEELTTQVESLNLERQNIQSIQTEEISKWKQKLGKFYVTEGATRLIKVVKDNQCTIITGIPGSGKSALAYHVAIHMQKTEGYTVLPIWLPSELIKLTNSNAKQLFVFDDVFGKYSLNECNLNCWESETRRIKMLLKNKILKVIVTCRSYLFENVSESLSSLSFAHFNLLSDEIKLSLIERKEISKLYLTDDIVSHLNDETIMMYNFFPLLCVMFKGQKMGDIDFFQNLNQFLKNEIGNFKRKKDAAFMALALLVLSNNSIEKECLQIGKDKYDIMLKDLFDEIDNRNSPSKTSILSNLRNLKNMYLTETESTFLTKHDKIFDIISHTVGNFIISCILRHGESSFISSRCQLTSLNEQHDVCTIMITDELETMYFERILKDIENGHNWKVFASIQMKFKKYRNVLIQYLEKSRKKLPSSKTDYTTPLHVTAAKGYYNISKYLLEKNREQISSLDDKNRSPLHNASMNGHHKIAQLLLSNGAKINQSDNEKYTPLLDSCNNGYVKVVEILLKRKANVNSCDKYSWSPLHMAASDGNADLIKLLIQHKAEVNKQMNNGMTPLYLACHGGHLLASKLLLESKADVKKCDNERCDFKYIEIVLVLLENGAEVNDHDEHGRTALYFAAKDGNTELILILIEHEADVNVQLNNGMTPIYIASEHDHLEAVKMLLSNKADINKCEENGWSPLHVAAHANHKEIVAYLCDHGNAEVNLSNKIGKSPLHLACEQGNKDIVTLLLKHGASINHCNESGYTPFHLVCSYGYKNIAEIFIKEGAAVNGVNKTGKSQILSACYHRHNEIAKLLLENGADVISPDEHGRTSLFSAAKDGNTDLIKILMEHDADVNFQTNNGITPLYIACREKHLEAVKMLLSYKADINKCDNIGWSPLHVASYFNHKEVVGYLCGHNAAEVNLSNKYGSTPLYLACQEGNQDVAQLLLKHDASINHCDEEGFTSFHKACSEGNINIVELLIKEDAAVNLPDKTDRTPLYIACQSRCTDVVELLLKYGVEVNKTRQFESEEGWTPLHVSAASGNMGITKLLLQNNAIVNVEDRNGHTPLYYATEKSYDRITELLVSHGAI
ncbi:unnamed protein product [Mytilus coruscus]|uniref:Uncharacterized protein n=1 Tax=Mytilus coruscus TaxID=42192 RepID=A0A6J7ZZQ7_MYTCO|nr:unnamed protein product [Mytilus coruscus]